MNRITTYRIVDHGIEHAQYFRGHGTAFTPYDYCVTGCGDSFAEALGDALEQMAQGDECDGVDFEAFETLMQIENTEYLKDAKSPEWVTEPSASDTVNQSAVENGEDPDEAQADSELYYYVSIDYNVEQDGTLFNFAKLV